MRYLRLSLVAVCTAALLMVAACRDSTAPPIAPDQETAYTAAAVDCEMRHMKFEFHVPYQPNFRGWVPESAKPTDWTGPGDPRLRVYHIMDTQALENQDNDPYRGVAYLTNTKGNSWEMRLRMIMTGHQDIWGLYYWGNSRGNVLRLDGKFRMDGSLGIFHHITGLVDVRGEAVLDSHATWHVDHWLETCGDPTPGPAAWFTVFDCDNGGSLCRQFFNTDMVGRDTRGNPVTFLWNFGDGRTSTRQNPEHTFSKDGVYDVEMTVTMAVDGQEYSASRTISVTVGDPGDPDPGDPDPGDPDALTADFTFDCRHETCSFKDASSGGPTVWEWTFENAAPAESTEQNPSGIRFLRYGSHTVTLKVWAGDDWSEANTNVVCRELGNRLRCG